MAPLTRRAAVASIVAAGAGFAAFGPRGQRRGASGRLVLDYWEKWTGDEAAAMQQVVDRFNDSQSRIQVRYFITAGIDQKALIAIAGGDPPDIVGLYNYNIPLYAETGAILPLDELGTPEATGLSRYAQGVQPILTHPDSTGTLRQFACPNTGGTLALYYNAAAFKDAGLDPARPPRTIAELDEFAAALDRREPAGEYRRLGFTPTEPGWWPWAWGPYFGGSLTDASARHASIDSPEHMAAFSWIRDIATRLDPTHVARFGAGWGASYDSPLNAFIRGEVAMILQGPWLANVINRVNPTLDYAVAPFPIAGSLASIADAGPVGLVEADTICIPRGSRNPEAAMEFIAFTQRQEIVEFLSTKHFKSTVLARASEEFVSNHPNRGVAVHNAIAQSPRGFIASRTRQFPQIRAEMGSLMPAVWNTREDVRTLLARTHQNVQNLLDLETRQRARRHPTGAQTSS